MSLNHREIDLVLAELDLEGAQLQRVVQPSYDSVVLGFYKSGTESELLISIAHGACRIHTLSSRPPKPQRPLRFMECLRSRLRGGRLESIVQLGDERILRLDFLVVRKEGAEEEGERSYRPIGAYARDLAHGSARVAIHGATDGAAQAAAQGAARDEAGPAESDGGEAAPEGGTARRYRLYARLWSGAGNLILCEEDGTIVDVLARRPKRGEISGECCAIEEELAAARVASGAGDKGAARGAEGAAGASGPARPARTFEPRDFPPAPRREDGGSYNERIEAFYASQGGELSRERLLEAARERFSKRERAIGARLAELEARAAEYRGGERFRELGDILMANQAAAPEGRFLPCEDFYRGGMVDIPLDPRKSVVENAQVFYERFRKAGSGLSELESEIASAKASLAEAKAELERLESLKEPLLIARALQKGGTAREPKKRPYPGLSLERDGWTILVGRSAKENDELLRRHVRGSDLWLHARDYSGSYVFVKARAGKSFPLEIMLDAGNLAIYYSKGRANGGGELYYTQAKYLRRAKDGPKGLVIPTQEKNLRVTLDEKRLRELKELIGDEGD